MRFQDDSILIPVAHMTKLKTFPPEDKIEIPITLIQII